MPLIEELPVTQSHRTTHGWAYVPDTGPIAAVQLGNRKRGRDNTAAATATATAKQQKANQARLDALDKENYKDGVSVPVPARQGEKKRDKKMSTNVRRILTYQRTFAHYLADEEANANTSATTLPPSKQPTRPDGRRKAPAATATTTTPAPPRRGRPPNSARKPKDKPETLSTPASIKQEDPRPPAADTPMTDAPAPPPPPASKPKYDPNLDKHPLLRTTGLPKMPSARVMAALLAEAPLSYTAARARIDETAAVLEKPTRKFCGVCGYWGKVKCRKCGEWTCGLLECWRGHQGVCVAAGMF